MAGLTQPGGNGSQLSIESDADPDAGGDGSYSCADLYSAVIAKGFKAADGITPAVVKLSAFVPALAAIIREIYIFLCSLQVGDGSGTSQTTFKDQDVIMVFGTGKTLLVANNGGAAGLGARRTEFGVKIPGSGRPTGRNGAQIFLGAAPTWRGTALLAGCYVRAAGNLIFQPGTSGLSFEIINSLLEATGTIGLGTTAGELSMVYNADLVSLGSGISGGLVQFNVTDAERLTIAAPNAFNIIRTAGIVRARDVILIGTATNQADLHNSSGTPWDLADVQFSGVAPQIDLSVTPTRDLRRYTAFLLDTAGAPKAGKRVVLYEKAGTPSQAAVVDAISDARGLIGYGSGVSQDRVTAREVPSGLTTWSSRGPFRVLVNDPGFADYDPALETHDETFQDFPHEANATGEQFDGLVDRITLRPPTAALPTSPQPYFRDQDILALLSSAGQDITLGGNTTRCVVDRSTVDLLAGFASSLMGTRIVATIKTGSLPGLVVGSPLSTGGQPYKAAEVRQVGDGALTEIVLAID